MQTVGARALRPAFDAVAPMKQAQEKILEFGRDNVESIVHTAQSCGEAMMGSLSLCSHEMKVMVESCSITSEAIRAMSAMAMQGATLSFAHWAEFVRDAIKCGSLDDLHALQEDYAHRLTNDYFFEADKLWDVLFDSYEEALKPAGAQDKLTARRARAAAAA